MLETYYWNAEGGYFTGHDQNLGWTLRENDIHVWIAGLSQSSQSVQGLAKILSPDERSRANRFHLKRDRNRFIVARGILRRILGKYLRIPPQHMEFSYGDYGKPYLPTDLNSPSIHFNVSHSGLVGVFAFARTREIGVDIEWIRNLNDMDEIADRFFSERESAVFQALPDHKKSEGFFNCWTRKEAFIKALGNGLSYELDKFDVSLTPGEPARLLSVGGSTNEASRWLMYESEPVAGYATAIATQAKDFVGSSTLH